jgi:DNA repair exonuclease SbcCD ATPase subunit
VQGLAEDVQRKAHERISAIVTRCLEAVLGEDSYQFRIDFTQKRGRTEAELIFERDGLRIDDALESLGGGICDLTSMALRIACLVLSLPRKRKVLFLDEPMRHLSANYRPLAAEFLRALAMELSIQIVLVTHHANFEIGKVIRL